MNPITLFIFRILLIAGGFILIYIIGMPMVETIQYRIKGIAVEGKVIGFRGSSKTSKTIFDDNIARIGKKHRARRPVYRYPIASGSLDSLEGFARSTVIFPWLNFDLHEEVTIVMDKSNPSRSHIFSKGIFLTDFILIFLCLYMIKLGITRSGA